MQTMISTTVKGKEIWYQSNCKYEGCWNIVSTPSNIFKGEFPTKEDALKSAEEQIKQLQV